MGQEVQISPPLAEDFIMASRIRGKKLASHRILAHEGPGDRDLTVVRANGLKESHDDDPWSLYVSYRSDAGLSGEGRPETNSMRGEGFESTSPLNTGGYECGRKKWSTNVINYS